VVTHRGRDWRLPGRCVTPSALAANVHRLDGTTVHPRSGPSDVLIQCRVAAGSLARDLAAPQIVWRAGIDLNPLDPAAPDTAAWLETLIWPEHEHRRRRLAGALPLAATAGVRIERGDLRSRLTALVAEAPAQATSVVLHSATFAYLTVGVRAAAAAAITSSGARWVSFEGHGIVTLTRDLPEPVAPGALFVAALDQVPFARPTGTATP
jgi:hypothetical protein